MPNPTSDAIPTRIRATGSIDEGRDRRLPDRQTVTDAFGVPFMQISTPAPSPSAEEEARGLAPCQCGVGVWLGAGRDPRAHASLCPVRLRDAIATALTKRDATPLDKRAADRLADEVAVLVRRGVIDARSPAGDALLDYREPPSPPRADRMAALEQRAEAAEARLEAMRAAALELLDALAAEVTIPEMTSVEMHAAADRTARAMTDLRAAVDAR